MCVFVCVFWEKQQVYCTLTGFNNCQWGVKEVLKHAPGTADGRRKTSMPREDSIAFRMKINSTPTNYDLIV